MAQNQAQFYMVYNLQGHPPAVIHGTVWAAQAEAERLAHLNPGGSFYVLKAIKVSKVATVITEDLQPYSQSSSRPDHVGNSFHVKPC